MAWSPSALTIVVFASVGLALVVALGALRRRPDPMAWPLAILMFAVVAWAVPHAISFELTRIERVVLFHRLRYPGTVMAPVAFLVLALRYAGFERWLDRRTYAALAVIPVCTIGIVWTNPLHRLFWTDLSLATVGGASILVETYGPWYWVNLGYLYLVTVASLVVLGAVVVSWGRLYRKQAALMFLGGLVPLATNAAITAGFGPDPRVDLTTSALAVSGATMGLALFHFDLLKVRPVARHQLVENLEDGVVVIGPEGTIRDFNPTAERVLTDLAIDQPAEAFLPADVTPDGGKLVVETDAGERVYHTRSTPLVDGRGRETGQIVYLNDVTELVQREQRIEVLNRVLRHNIRNELNVISGHLDVLESRVDPSEREPFDAARRGTDRLLEIAETARSVERTLQRSDTIPAEVSGIAESVADAARERYPDAAIEYESPEGDSVQARVVDPELFERALDELVVNAVEHSDRPVPSVTLRIATDGDRVVVAVSDDGPGIPEIERTALTGRTESPLDHATGLGLWVVRWTMDLSGGEISLAEDGSRGTTVTLTLPADRE